MTAEHTPAYRKIMKEILDDISNGTFQVGDMIPSQLEYAQRYDVSRVTVREAINKLISMGVVESTRGKGTVVLCIPGAPAGLSRSEGFSHPIEELNNQPSANVHSKLISLVELSAEHQVAKRLQIPEGAPVIKICRVRYVQSAPVALETAYLNKELVESVDFKQADLEHGSLYRLLETQGNVQILFADETFSAIMCPPYLSEFFGFGAEPVISINRVTYMQGEVPLEYCENIQRSDMWSIQVRTYTKINPAYNMKKEEGTENE